MILSLGGTLGAGVGRVKAKSPVAWENIELFRAGKRC